jgi:hypothetical protein
MPLHLGSGQTSWCQAGQTVPTVDFIPTGSEQDKSNSLLDFNVHACPRQLGLRTTRVGWHSTRQVGPAQGTSSSSQRSMPPHLSGSETLLVDLVIKLAGLNANHNRLRDDGDGAAGSLVVQYTSYATPSALACARRNARGME